MSEFNMFVGASTDFAAEAKALLRPDADENGNPVPPTPAVQFTLLNGLSEDTRNTLNGTHDGTTVQRMFKSVNANGRTYKVWSFYTNKPANPQDVKVDFLSLSAMYPLDFQVMGIWHTDTGEAVNAFPVSPQLINFMPDVITDNSDPENPVFGPATQLTDVNLLAGQAPRDFT